MRLLLIIITVVFLYGFKAWGGDIEKNFCEVYSRCEPAGEQKALKVQSRDPKACEEGYQCPKVTRDPASGEGPEACTEAYGMKMTRVKCVANP